MRRFSFILLTCAVLLNILLFSGCQKRNEIIETGVADPETKSSEETLLACNFYNENEFNGYINQAEAYSCDNELKCGVVPHHLLAGRMIASFFYTASLKCTDIDTIVIVAPIHEPEKNTVCTTLKSWNTPFGILTNNTDISQQFISDINASEDDYMVTLDHSASALIPFVKYYFPSSSVSCILVAKTADKDIPEKLTELFDDPSMKNCLYVFSMDFSHYLTPENTDAHDMETRKAVFSYDLATVTAMTNDNVDSPYTLETFMRYTKSVDGKITELNHSNSLIESGVPYSLPQFRGGLTSYFIFAGSK